MTAKEELIEYFHKKNDGKKILDEYQGYLDRATKMTSLISETSARTNLPSDKVGDNVSMMADLSIEYFDMFIEAEQIKVKIISKLLKLERPYKDVLWHKFINELTLTETAQKIRYSIPQTKRIYKKAMIKFSKLDTE